MPDQKIQEGEIRLYQELFSMTVWKRQEEKKQVGLLIIKCKTCVYHKKMKEKIVWKAFAMHI